MIEINIGNRKIGGNRPVFIIAEAGINHNGDINLAKKLIDVAKEAGTDAVKFQSFFADEELTIGAPKAEYQKRATKKGESYYTMIKKLEFSKNQHRVLMKYAKERNIIFLSTPSDEKSANLLQELGVPAFKIGSNDITTLPMLKHIAKFGKPMIVSTGMATLEEIKEAVEAIKSVGNKKIVLLQCTSSYPAKFEEANLNVIKTLKNTFHVPVGYSDHTLGIEAPITAAALGANIIEKHFTLDKNLPGPDHKMSLEPDELKKMVISIRKVKKMLGSPVKKPLKSEMQMRRITRKSIAARVDIPKGSKITEEMLAFKRPGTGIPPKFVDMIIGKTTREKIRRDELLSWKKIK